MDTEMFQVFGLDNSIEVIEVQEMPQRPKPTIQTEKPVRVLTEPITGRGGYRPGNGRKTNEFREKVRENLEGDGEVDYAVARAKKESWLAKTVELDYRIKQGEYVARDTVRGECAKAFSAVAQTLRSLPDALERREGISPALAEKISRYLDDAMNTLCDDFKRLAGDA